MTASTEAPAVTLRRAAERLRKLTTAPGITPPPWLSMDGGDRLVHDPGHDLDPPVYVVDEPMSNPANAAYIAAMHPSVGLVLADLLDTAATNHVPDIECGFCIPRRNPLRLPCPYLVVARQILGEA